MHLVTAFLSTHIGLIDSLCWALIRVVTGIEGSKGVTSAVISKLYDHSSKYSPSDSLGEYFELYQEVSIHLMKFGSDGYFVINPFISIV